MIQTVNHPFICPPIDLLNNRLITPHFAYSYLSYYFILSLPPLQPSNGWKLQFTKHGVSAYRREVPNTNDSFTTLKGQGVVPHHPVAMLMGIIDNTIGAGTCILLIVFWCIYLFVYLIVFVYLFIHLSIYSSINSSIYGFMNSRIHRFMHLMYILHNCNNPCQQRSTVSTLSMYILHNCNNPCQQKSTASTTTATGFAS